MAEIGKNNSEDFLPEDIFAEVDSTDQSNRVVRSQDVDFKDDNSIVNIDKKREKIDKDTTKHKANKKMILFVLFFVVFLSFAFIFINVIVGLNKYGSDKKKSNSDISEPIKNSSVADSNNQDTSSSSTIKDTDSDGLYDIEESKFGTDSTNPDSDADYINDGDEIKKYKTNALSSDTDGDGLADYDEVLIYKTNPLNSDTDTDGFRDMDEISNGYNPIGTGKISSEYLISIDLAKKIKESILRPKN